MITAVTGFDVIMVAKNLCVWEEFEGMHELGQEFIVLCFTYLNFKMFLTFWKGKSHFELIEILTLEALIV